MNDGNLIINTFNRFRGRGWMPGLNGALALLCNITDSSQKIYITPEQKKRLTTNDLFLLRSLYGEQEVQEPLNQIDETLNISRWTPLFLEVIAQHPNARAVAQVSTKWTNLASRMSLEAWRKRSENNPNILRLAHWELLKDLTSKKELLIPIINLDTSEKMFQEAKTLLSVYTDTCAILIRDYGVVVWGEDFDQVENRVEILEHICEMQIYSYALLSPPSFV